MSQKFALLQNSEQDSAKAQDEENSKKPIKELVLETLSKPEYLSNAHNNQTIETEIPAKILTRYLGWQIPGLGGKHQRLSFWMKLLENNPVSPLDKTLPLKETD